MKYATEIVMKAGQCSQSSKKKRKRSSWTLETAWRMRSLRKHEKTKSAPKSTSARIDRVRCNSRECTESYGQNKVKEEKEKENTINDKDRLQE